MAHRCRCAHSRASQNIQLTVVVVVGVVLVVAVVVVVGDVVVVGVVLVVGLVVVVGVVVVVGDVLVVGLHASLHMYSDSGDSVSIIVKVSLARQVYVLEENDCPYNALHTRFKYVVYKCGDAIVYRKHNRDLNPE